MALFAKYYITSPRGVYIDWSSHNGFSLLNKKGELVGGNGDDYASVEEGNTFDATSLFKSAGNDTLFLPGRLSDYTQSVDINGVYTFTRTAGLPAGQTEIVKFLSGPHSDIVYFADGHVVLKSDIAQGSGTPLQNQSTFEYRNILAGDLLSGGTPSDIGAYLSGVNLGTEATKVYIFDPSGFDVPKLPVAGEALEIIGGTGNDSYFVEKGTTVDATALTKSSGDDNLYLTGKFSDYTQSVDSNGVYTFTRVSGLPAGQVEVVKFSSVTNADAVYFANGHLVIKSDDIQLTGTPLQNQDSFVFRNILEGDLIAGGTPGLPDAPTLNVTDSDNDGKIDVSGIAEPGSTVTVTWPDGTISTVVTDPVTGAYSTESPTVQTNGDVKAKVTDSDGNVSAETVNPYTSTTAVDEPTLNVSDSDNDGKINASGVAKANSIVSVTWPDGTVSTTVADTQGKYVIESPSVQTSGEVKAKYTDTNGVVSGETINPYVDNQVPVIPTLNVSDSDNDGKINVSGIAEPKSTVTVTWPDGTTSTATTDPISGAYSVESPTVQANGDVKAKATDANGNIGAETVNPYTNSTPINAPTLNVSDSDNDGKINASGIAKAGSTVSITWPDGTINSTMADAVTGAYSIESLVAQANGDVKAKSIDSDGIISAEAINPYRDTQAPSIPTLNLSDSDSDGKINASGVAEAGSTVTITWPDGTTSTAVADAVTGAYSVESPSIQSSGSVKAKATDINGNIGSEAMTLYSDSTAPIAPTLNVSDSDNDGKIDASGISEAGSTVTITWPNGTITTVATDPLTGRYFVESPTVQLNGDVKAKATDINGRVSSETINAYVDTQAPDAPTLNVSDSDNDGKINVSGVAEPKSTVTITWPDGTTSTVVADAGTGAYSIESLTLQPTGNVKAKVTDVNNNNSLETINYYSDLTVPVAPSLNVSDSDDDGKINASGVAEPKSTVTVTWPDGTTSTVVADALTGAYSIESPTVQSNGDVKAKATDADGNTSLEALNHYTDLTAPDAPELNVSDSDNDGKIDVSGVVEPKSTVTITWPDGTTSTVVADPVTGAYSLESPTSQPAGDVKAKATDINGNISSEKIVAYADLQIRVAPILNVTDNDSDGKIEVGGVAEAGSTVTVTWPDGTTSTAIADAITGIYSVESPTVQTNGEVKAKATDINGKVSSEVMNSYIDKTAPLSPTLNVSDSDNDGKINVSGIAEPKSTVTITWPDGTISTAVADPVTGAYSTESPTVQENGNVKAKATDINGNIGSEAISLYSDSTALISPTLAINDNDNNGKINASGVAEPKSTVTITWPDGTTSTVSTDTLGAYSVESPTSQPNGNVKAKATDANGNVSPEITTAYSDTQAPVEPTLNVNDGDKDGKIDISGVAEAGSTVTITWPDGTTSTALTNAVTGAYSVESPTVQPNGNVKAKATDVNGNVSTEIINPYADTTVPVTPTLVLADSDRDGKIDASGVAEPKSTVTITWPDRTTSTIVADAVTGAYSVESPTVQQNGDVKAKAVDINGNISSEITTAYVDTMLPLAPTLVLVDSDSDGRINASGVAEPGSTVTVTWPDGSSSSVPANSSTGAYSVESPMVQANGDVKVKATDINGNVGPITTIAYVDTTPPLAATLIVSDSDNDGRINVSGVAEPKSTVTIKWTDGTTNTVVADAVTGVYSLESSMVHLSGNVIASVTDVNGNVGLTTTTTPYNDTQAPFAATLSVIDSDSDEKINASGVAEASSTVTITWPDGTTSTVVADALTGAYSIESPTVQESGNVVAKVTDVNGNVSSTTTTYYTDVTPPVILNLSIVSATGIQNNLLKVIL